MIEGLHLNGTWVSKEALIDLASAKKVDIGPPEWERAFWTFLSDWFGDKDYLSVQTSGSTGIPKTLEIPKRFFTNSARMTLDFLRIMPGDRALLCLSANYIAGKMMIVRALTGGLKLTVVSPQVSAILTHDEEIDLSAMVPTQVQTILDRPDGRDKISKVGKLLIGGGPVSRGLEDRLSALDNQIFATYGMTETVSHIALRRLNGPDHSSYYKALAGVKIRTDENDCLLIDAPTLADNTIHTTDLVRTINDDEFEVIGRFDHVINSGGIKHYPEVIEEKLVPFIANRFIISAIPDRRLGEKLILIIEAKDRLRYDEKKLEKTLKENLLPYEVPKKVFFLEAFPVVGNDKLSRKTITWNAMKYLATKFDNEQC
jgi:O-succinylbenzoic acid--CoA ligase